MLEKPKDLNSHEATLLGRLIASILISSIFLGFYLHARTPQIPISVEVGSFMQHWLQDFVPKRLPR